MNTYHIEFTDDEVKVIQSDYMHEEGGWLRFGTERVAPAPMWKLRSETHRFNMQSLKAVYCDRME